MPRNHMILCIMITLLSGCASTFIGSYKVPQDGPVAELTVKDDTYLDISQLIRYKEARDCSGGMTEMLKDEMVESGGSRVTMVPAGKPLAFYIVGYHRSMGRVKSCGILSEFTPVAGQKYLLMFSTLKEHCTLEIHKQTAESDEFIADPTHIIRKRNEEAYWNTDPHCYPKT